MPEAALSPIDQSVLEIVTGPAVAAIADVIARMEALDAALPNEDGLKWLNRLYLMVTKQVDLAPPNGRWQSPVWLTQLDVVFASLYFSALADYLSRRTLPSSWRAMFDMRLATGIDRIQSAMAGMNAHINHDLALALVKTNEQLSLTPGPGSAEHADYQSVNKLLNTVMPSALTMLAVDTLGVLAQDTGKVGRLLAFWDMCRARDLAWDFSGHITSISGLQRDIALNTQDSLTGVIGRAILLMV